MLKRLTGNSRLCERASDEALTGQVRNAHAARARSPTFQRRRSHVPIRDDVLAGAVHGAETIP
jgi:hypothetical protein